MPSQAPLSPASTTAPRLPRRFGPYALFDYIGKGGMAEIYLARAKTKKKATTFARLIGKFQTFSLTVSQTHNAPVTKLNASSQVARPSLRRHQHRLNLAGRRCVHDQFQVVVARGHRTGVIVMMPRPRLGKGDRQPR